MTISRLSMVRAGVISGHRPLIQSTLQSTAIQLQNQKKAADDTSVAQNAAEKSAHKNSFPIEQIPIHIS